jgi:hypothetical protein
MTANRNPKKTLFCLITTMIAFLGVGVWSSKTEAQSQTIPQGVFKLSSRPAVYYSNGEGAYCWYNSWSELVRLTGTSRPEITQYAISQQGVIDTLRKMRYDGICTGGESIPTAHPDPNIFK